MRAFLYTLARNLLRLVAVGLVASVLLFVALEAMPEDPVALRMKKPDPARVQEIREELGLNDPALVRYWRYLGSFVVLDWGHSLDTGRPVKEEVARYLPATLELGFCALLAGCSAGIALVLGAYWTQSPLLLKLTTAIGALGLTVPIYWLGILLTYLFSRQLGWFPTSGRMNELDWPEVTTGFFLIDTLLAGDLAAFWQVLRYLALPTLTLALYPMALVAGTLRARLEDSRIHALVRALRAKGLSESSIWGRHILRLMGAPLAILIGTNAGGLIGGAVLTETVYSWPGMGRFMVEAVLDRDFYVIANGLLLVVLLAFMIVTLSDVIAVVINPRLRVQERGGEA